MRSAAICLALALAPSTSADTWRYVVPPGNDAFAHPPPRTIPLSSTKPSDLKETVRYRGTKRRYARLVYGSGRTAPVTVVVDEVGRAEIDLYLDADRDKE